MFVVDETSIILNILELSYEGSNGLGNGGLFAFTIIGMCLFLGGCYLVGSCIMKIYKKIYFLDNWKSIFIFDKIFLAVDVITLILIFIVTMIIGTFTYLAASSGSESLVRYANIRYIKYVKDDPNVKPDVKELIEKYISEREAELKTLKEIKLKERIKRLSEKVIHN